MYKRICGIDLEIEKKDIKNLHLYILPPDGRVKITAPRRMSEAVIERFVLDKLDWITKKRAQVMSRRENAAAGYRTGDTVYVWGTPYTLTVERGARNTLIIEESGTAVLMLREDADEEKRADIVKEWYRRELKDAAPPLIKKWADITGLRPSSWQTKDMRTRWGTCNTRTGKIWLNVRLAQHPPECLEYVILHELAHLRVPNHGAEFYAILDSFMPDWKRRKKLLNK